MSHKGLCVVALLLLGGLAGCGKGPDKAAPAAPNAGSPAPALTPAHAGSTANAATTVTGTVAETMDSGGYTYARLQTAKGDVWIAATEFKVRQGERLTAPLEMPMTNFNSQTLKRSFPLIYFVSQVAREGHPLSAPQGQSAAPPAPAHGNAAAAAADDAAPIERIAPAPGGHSIADVWAKRKSLAGQQVVVRGKVVKVNRGILERNWIHLQDGSGSAADRTNDLVVTTVADVKVGDIVTMSGVLATGIDIGGGYAYDVILEKAVLK